MKRLLVLTVVCLALFAMPAMAQPTILQTQQQQADDIAAIKVQLQQVQAQNAELLRAVKDLTAAVKDSQGLSVSTRAPAAVLVQPPQPRMAVEMTMPGMGAGACANGSCGSGMTRFAIRGRMR
jgi:uncharacterized protein YlxW (UPF0749 family)